VSEPFRPPPPALGIVFVTDDDAEPVDAAALDEAVADLLLDLVSRGEGTDGRPKAK
jgi:hypothetical protein